MDLRRKIEDPLYSLKWFIQRGKRGYADYDWWNMDNYLCRIIISMLKELKEKRCGDPIGMEEIQTPEDWSNKIDEMIEAFEAAERVINDEYYLQVAPNFPEQRLTTDEIKKCIELRNEDEKIFEEKMKIFTKYFFALGD